MNYPKRVFVILLSSLSLTMFQFQADAKAPVWKVSNSENVLYIGGTIHLLSKQDYPLPNAFETAFGASELIVFETDVDGIAKPDAQSKFSKILMYQDERNLQSELQAKTYAALESYLTSRNLPVAMFERFTPAGLNLTLVVLELQSLGIESSSGVENFFNGKIKAENGSKRVDWLESIEQQVSFIARMNDLDADTLLRSTLSDLDSIKQEWPKLLAAWRSGNVKELEELGINRMQKEFPELYTFMLANRNAAWVPKITKMLATPEVEFVLVGALHLAGKDSVLTQLSSAGFTVEQQD